MTDGELALSVSAVFSSSASQIFMKSASSHTKLAKAILMLAIACALQMVSVILSVLVLRTVQLSQLVPFAGIAYFLVPIGSHFVFKERLLPRFWLGALFIFIGIICTQP